jgi:hypothetical protein
MGINCSHLFAGLLYVMDLQPSNLVCFDFVPQLLSLLQNPTIMTAENLVIDINNPLKPRNHFEWGTVRRCLPQSLQSINHGSQYPTLCSHLSMERLNPCNRACSLFIEAIHVYSSNFYWEILEEYQGMGFSWLYAQEEVIICSEPGSTPGRPHPKLSCRAYWCTWVI